MSPQNTQEINREELIEEIIALSNSLKISQEKEHYDSLKSSWGNETTETAERTCEEAELENRMENILS